MEYILVNGAGSHPARTINSSPAFTYGNGGEEEVSFDWPLPPSRQPLCRVHPQVGGWNRFVGRVHLAGRPHPFIAFPNAATLFPHMACPDCGQNHPWFGLFAGGSTFKHWPASDMDDFILAVAAAPEEIGRVATHTSIMDCNAYMGGMTPPRATNWLFLTGALQPGGDPAADRRLNGLVDSWLTPGRIITGNEAVGTTRLMGMSKGAFFYEGYDYQERAYAFRKVRGDAAAFALDPQAPVIHPVFVVNGRRGGVEVRQDGMPLASEDFAAQQEGEDLVLWLDATVAGATRTRT